MMSFNRVQDFSDAPCNGLFDMFHPEVPANTRGDDADPYFAKAEAVCATCPYTGIGGPCYERWVNSGRPSDDGVWFGVNPRRLRRLKRGKPADGRMALPPKVRTEVRQMSTQGWTVAALAQRHNVDVRTIKNILKET